MSYNVNFLIDTGAPDLQSVADFNFTSNCQPMFAMAIDGGLWALHGKGARYCAETLRAALHDMQQRQCEYKELDPANGWGSFDSAFLFVQTLFEASIVHKNCIITVSC
jgi:hypothetical protein